MVQSQNKKDVNILKNKIKFVSKMAKMQKILREENENIIKIKVILKSQFIITQIFNTSASTLV